MDVDVGVTVGLQHSDSRKYMIPFLRRRLLLVHKLPLFSVVLV